MYDHPAGRDLKSSFSWLEFAAGLPSRPVPYTGVSASFQGFKGSCVLQSISAINANAAAQTLILHDGEDNTGQMVFPVSVPTGANLFQPFGPRGILMETGVYVQLAGGPWTITLLVVPLWHYSNTPPGE